MKIGMFLDLNKIVCTCDYKKPHIKVQKFRLPLIATSAFRRLRLHASCVKVKSRETRRHARSRTIIFISFTHTKQIFYEMVTSGPTSHLDHKFLGPDCRPLLLVHLGCLCRVVDVRHEINQPIRGQPWNLPRDRHH